MGLSRRMFLGTGAIGSVAANAVLAADIDEKSGMPRRVLGRTGARVSILGIGLGPTANQKMTEKQIGELVNHALDLGISYIDTAARYNNGASERGVAEVIKTRRKQVWLTTKIADRNYDGVMRMIEASLKRLQTDHVDLLHIHHIEKADDLAAIEAPNGPLKAFYKIRDQKIARFIGITSHRDPSVLKDALERHDFDCVQMSLNAAHAGSASGIDHSFEKIALPVANKKNMGVLAMKVFAGGRLRAGAPDEKLIRYSLSLPITSAVAGMPTIEALEENVRIAKAFQPLPASEMKDLSERLSRTFQSRLHRFFLNHQDA